MKKGIILLSALLVLASAAFAEVTAVKEGDVAKATWTYTPDYDAGFVGLVGDFQGWNLDGATPMTKNDDGSWSVTLEFPLDAEVSYKFNVDGEWTEDPNAPFSKDDGFGGLNGVAVMEELTAAPGAAPVARGLAPGLFYAAWADVRAFTASTTSTTEGFEYQKTDIHQKAYLKSSGYLFKDLLYIATEFRLFDGAITLNEYEAVYNAGANAFEYTETKKLITGAEEFASLPWTIFNQFADGSLSSADFKGKFRGLLELDAINTNISHSVGWSKTTLGELGNFWIEYYGDPDGDDGTDSNAGITEIFSQEAVDLGALDLNYYVIFDAHDGGTYNNIVAFDGSAIDMVDYELVNVLYSNTTDIGFLLENATGITMLGAEIAATDALTVKVQGGVNYTLVENASLETPFFANLGIGYDFGMGSVYADGQYYGADSLISEAGNFISEQTLSLDLSSDINVYLENEFTAIAEDFTSPADTLVAGASIALAPAEISPEVEVALPLDGADFAVNYFQVGASLTDMPLNTTLRWEPSSDFATNLILLDAGYDLGDNNGMNAGVAVNVDDLDTTRLFGVHLGYYAQTDWTMVKSPYWFANLNYNLHVTDGDDNYQLKDIDDDAWATANGFSFRVGIRMDF